MECQVVDYLNTLEVQLCGVFLYLILTVAKFHTEGRYYRRQHFEACLKNDNINMQSNSICC